jgi:DNA-binding NarL/FixJ family response regulator
MLRVLLVEDSAVLVDRLRETLGALEGVEVVDAVADESSAVVAATAQPRKGTGFGVLQRLGRACPEIVVFTSYGMPEYKRRATALGVRHFLVKAQDHERLPALIRELELQRRTGRA